MHFHFYNTQSIIVSIDKGGFVGPAGNSLSLYGEKHCASCHDSCGPISHDSRIKMSVFPHFLMFSWYWSFSNCYLTDVNCTISKVNTLAQPYLIFGQALLVRTYNRLQSNCLCRIAAVVNSESAFLGKLKKFSDSCIFRRHKYHFPSDWLGLNLVDINILNL